MGQTNSLGNGLSYDDPIRVVLGVGCCCCCSVEEDRLVWASKKLPTTSTMSDEDDDEGASGETAMVVAGCW